MAFPKWFNEVDYLNSKLALLQKNGEAYTSVLQVADAIASAGMDAFTHYNTFGSKEGLSPSSAFNAAEYCSFKLKALQADAATKDEWTGKTWQDVQYAIHKAGMSLGQHYAQFGSVEGVSMSNSFDTTAYLTAKLVKLQADEATKGEWATKTVTDVAKAINATGMDAYTHYMTFKGGANEVAEDAKFVPADPVNPGGNTAFTLTTGADRFIGNSANDVFVAGLDSSLTAGDYLDGAGGTNTLRLYGNNTNGLPDATIKNIQIIEHYTDAGINVSKVDGVTEVWQMRANGKTVTANATQAVGFAGDTFTTETVTFAGTDGTEDAATLKFKDATIGTSVAVTDTGAGVVTIEKLTIEATGKNNVAAISNGVLTDLIIKGEGSFKADGTGLGAGTTIKTIDASGLKGGLDLSLTSGNLNSKAVITGGEGNDTIRLSAALSANKDITLSGGSGDDTLLFGAAMDLSTAAKVKDFAQFSGFETIGTYGAGANFTGDRALLGDDVKAFHVSNTGTMTVTNAKAGDLFILGGDPGNAAVSGGAVSITMAAGETGAVKVEMQGGHDLSTGELALLGTNQIEIVSNNVGKSSATNGINTLKLTNDGTNILSNTSVTLTGDADFKLTADDIAGVVTAGGLIIKAGDFTGALDVTGTKGIDVITGGKGGNTITGGSGDDIINISASVNKVDTIIFSAAASSANGHDTITGFEAGAGNDVLDVHSLGSLTQGGTSKTLLQVASSAQKVDVTSANKDANASGVIFVSDQVKTDWSDVATVIKNALTIDGTASNNGVYVIGVDNGTDTQFYLYSDANNGWNFADDVTLVGTVKGAEYDDFAMGNFKVVA